jgi:hypothetical protein
MKSLGRIVKAARPAPRKPAPFKPNMPMVPSKLPAPRTNVTTGLGSKVAGASTSKPMLQGIGSLGKTVAKSMMKKVKKYAEGGLAGLAETAESLMGEVDGMANNINYGSSTPSGNNQPLGMLGMKKGGEVKASKAPKASSASKRGDGIATKGKTKGRIV